MNSNGRTSTPRRTPALILSVSVFEKTPLLQAFQRTEYSSEDGDLYNQLSLWD